MVIKTSRERPDPLNPRKERKYFVDRPHNLSKRSNFAAHSGDLGLQGLQAIVRGVDLRQHRLKLRRIRMDPVLIVRRQQIANIQLARIQRLQQREVVRVAVRER